MDALARRMRSNRVLAIQSFVQARQEARPPMARDGERREEGAREKSNPSEGRERP
ncbi:MAG: hypothetical protein ACO1SV_14790 [Fimbriimonas sp.]